MSGKATRPMVCDGCGAPATKHDGSGDYCQECGDWQRMITGLIEAKIRWERAEWKTVNLWTEAQQKNHENWVRYQAKHRYDPRAKTASC